MMTYGEKHKIIREDLGTKIPRSHKEAFLSEVRDYITDQFYSILKDASDHCRKRQDGNF